MGDHIQNPLAGHPAPSHPIRSQRNVPPRRRKAAKSCLPPPSCGMPGRLTIMIRPTVRPPSCRKLRALMNKLSVAQLTQAQETLLIPLWARAVETQQPQPILQDEKAVELVAALDYDFDQFNHNHHSRQAGYCIRAVIVDRWVRSFLRDNPDGTVVEIGAGLDTRFERLDNDRLRWFDLDLPEAMQVRQTFFEETPRRSFLSTSVLEPDWIETVAESNPSATLFVAEGVFYFLTKDEVKVLLTRLADRFPGASIVFDSQSPFFLWWARATHPLASSKADLKFCLGQVREIESWDRRFRVEESAGFGDAEYYAEHFHRLPLFYRAVRRVFPPARNMFRLTRVRLG